MRRTLVLLAAVFIALPMFGSWWPVWSERDVHLLVGETATVYVSAQWSGLVDYGNGVHWTFGSTNPAVAMAMVSISSPAAVPVRIIGISPGVARIAQLGSQGFGQTYVSVQVSCGVEPPVTAATPLVSAARGERVTLIATSEIANRTAFHWYAGRVGDTSHPIESAGPQAAFVAMEYGVQHVWVEAVTPCSATVAEFAIEVPLPKSRAVRR